MIGLKTSFEETENKNSRVKNGSTILISKVGIKILKIFGGIRKNSRQGTYCYDF